LAWLEEFEDVEPYYPCYRAVGGPDAHPPLAQHEKPPIDSIRALVGAARGAVFEDDPHTRAVVAVDRWLDAVITAASHDRTSVSE
jgi:hypothetical protein